MNENESSFSIAYAGVMTTQIGYESSSAYTEVAPLYGEVFGIPASLAADAVN
jgi:hypothetical protein